MCEGDATQNSDPLSQRQLNFTTRCNLAITRTFNPAMKTHEGQITRSASQVSYTGQSLPAQDWQCILVIYTSCIRVNHWTDLFKWLCIWWQDMYAIESLNIVWKKYSWCINELNNPFACTLWIRQAKSHSSTRDIGTLRRRRRRWIH